MSWIKITDQMPPSGKVVLLKQQREGYEPFPIIGQYAEKYSVESAGDDDESEYNDADDTYYCPEGFYEQQMNWDVYQWIAIDSYMPVIEWMEIPE